MTSAPYFKIHVAAPEATGAGVVDKIQDNAGNSPDNANYLYNSARMLARTYICRAVSTFLMSMSLLTFLSFISISQSSTNAKIKFVTSIAIVSCLVQGMAWRDCSKVRNEFWSRRRSIVVEMMADSWRVGAFTITYPLMVLALYTLVNNTDKGVIFASPQTAALVAAINALALAVVRIGTDEVWDMTSCATMSLGLIMAGVAAACLFLVCFDFGNQASDIKDGYFLRSFLFVYIGSASMAGISSIVRFVYKTYPEGRFGEYIESLSLVKDLIYGAIDCYALGFFALWVSYTNYNMELFNLPQAVLN